MGKDSSVTPKTTVTLVKLGPGFDKSNASAGLNFTFKTKKDKFTASIAGTHKTLQAVKDGQAKSCKDLVASLDYKANKHVLVQSSYELATKNYKVGATFEDKLLKKPVTLKATYTSKDKLVSGEATVTINKHAKVNTTFNQQKLLTAKYIIPMGSVTYEPAYNFTTKAPSLAVTKKEGKDTYKATYDFKSQNGSLEWNRKPFKVVLSGKVAKETKPTLQIVHEDVFSF